jgi:hypothetical protein
LIFHSQEQRKIVDDFRFYQSRLPNSIYEGLSKELGSSMTEKPVQENPESFLLDHLLIYCDKTLNWLEKVYLS